jgi:hypothetical protein
MAEDEHTEPHRAPGWAAPRQPKDEPPVKSLSLGLAKWLERASKHTFPNWKGTNKSS